MSLFQALLTGSMTAAPASARIAEDAMNALLCPALFLLFSVSSTASRLALHQDDDLLRVTLDGRPVLEYVKTEKEAPSGLNPAYRRSGYLHPVFSPGGQEVSGDFAPDHPHQHGLFMAWTRSEFADSPVDFWNLAKEQGRVEFRKLLKTEVKEDRLSFSCRHAFVAGKGEQRQDALHEVWTVTVYATSGDHFLFDIESVQECATEEPLVLPRYHYGGMAFRGNAQWLKTKKDQSNPLRFLTSEGKNRLEGNHSRPHWVAMTGKIDGEEATVAVFGHPENFRAPQPVRLHPEKPYFCFAPMVTGEFRITPGAPYTSRYRYLVTSAKADRDLIERTWEDYRKENS